MLPSPLAMRLGVETCFATPGWDTLTAGNWANKWDISVGSMTIITVRQQVLDFSVPYYDTPAVVAVLANSASPPWMILPDRHCAGVSTTYETWLQWRRSRLARIHPFTPKPPGITVVPLESDQECAQALAAGRNDFAGYVTSVTVVDANIAAGIPVAILVAQSIQKFSPPPSTSHPPCHRHLARRSGQALHRHAWRWTLTELSNQWFEEDLTQSS